MAREAEETTRFSFEHVQFTLVAIHKTTEMMLEHVSSVEGKRVCTRQFSEIYIEAADELSRRHPSDNTPFHYNLFVVPRDALPAWNGELFVTGRRDVLLADEGADVGLEATLKQVAVLFASSKAAFQVRTRDSARAY